MRKAALLLILGLALQGPVFPAAPNAKAETQAQKNLRINRLLLRQYSRELADLRRQQRAAYTDERHRRLGGLRLKIRALKDDARRLQGRLPLTAQADAFLNGFIRRHGKPSAKPARLGVPKNRQEAERLHEEALRLVADRRLKEAAAVYEEIALHDPNDDEAYLLLGHVYLMLGEYDRAEFAYFNSVHIDRSNYDEILPFYQNLVVQSPNDDEAYQFLGYAYVILGNVPLAKEAYEESLRINPANLEAQKGLALLASKFGV